jgi:hypothetical protein
MAAAGLITLGQGWRIFERRYIGGDQYSVKMPELLTCPLISWEKLEGQSLVATA